MPTIDRRFAEAPVLAVRRHGGPLGAAVCVMLEASSGEPRDARLRAAGIY